MANLPISVLPNLLTSGVTPDDLLVIVNSGETKNIKTSDFQTYINSNNLFVEIIASDVTTLTADVSGGVPPYSYEWKLAEQIFYPPSDPLNHYIEFTTPTTLQDVEFGFNFSFPGDYIRFGGNNGGIGLVKVIVTDSIGRKASDTYLVMDYPVA